MLFHPDYSLFDGIRVTHRGDGREYVVNVKHQPMMPDSFYQAHFKTVNGEWNTSEIKWNEFYINYQAQITKYVQKPSVHNIVAVGIGIETFETGPFEIELKSVELFSNLK